MGRRVLFVVKEIEGNLTWGQRLADKVAALNGSWAFILFLVFLTGSWALMSLMTIHCVNGPQRSNLTSKPGEGEVSGLGHQNRRATILRYGMSRAKING